MFMKIAITSVYANPLHPGHVECFELSKELADELWVIVNNDNQAKLKRGVDSFQDENYRKRLVESLKPVTRAVISIDTDASVCKTLDKLIEEAKSNPLVKEVIFTKGGDRFADEIPERKVCDSHNVRIVDGLGAKTHNSSAYVNRISNELDKSNLRNALSKLPDNVKEINYLEVGYRPWGVYYVVEEKLNYKVKKIIVNPKQRLSLQSHKHRSEHWVVVDGQATVQIRHQDDPDYIGHQIIRSKQSCHIPQGYIHRLTNETDELLVIIEVQSGDYLGEDDIVRYEDDYARVDEKININQNKSATKVSTK